MKTFDFEQGSDEWKIARASIATASYFADILANGRSGAEAVGRRNYRAKLVVQRITGRPVENTFQSFAMTQGIEREPLAREAYEVATGHLVEKVGFIRHSEIETGVSPDGLIGSDGGLEIKCPELATHMAYLRRSDEPPEYRAQIQGLLWISERKWCDFVSFNPDFPDCLQLVIRRVHRDEDYIPQLGLAVMLFMDEVRLEEKELRALIQRASACSSEQPHV